MKIKILRQTHPNHRKEALERYEALYCGGEEWRALVEQWIPQNAQEPDELWVERKARATYTNHAGPILDLIAAWLFTEAPVVDGLDEAWLANCDHRGTSWGTWWRETFLRALRDQWVFVWRNMPARAPNVVVDSRATEERLGLHLPLLVRLEAEQVLDWGENEAGALTWVLFEQEVSERGGPDQMRGARFVWTFIDAAVIRQWEWRPTQDKPTPSDEDEASELPAIPHNAGGLPVVRLQLPDGLHAMGKLEDPSVGLTRLENDLEWALHRGAHALMVMKIKDSAVRPVLGAGYYLQVGPEDDVSYAEPAGACYAALEARIDKRREDVYRVVHQMAAGTASQDQAAARSAASKSMDWQSLEVVLDAYGDLVRAVMLEVAKMAAVPLGVAADGVSITGLEGWGEEDLATFLEQAAEATGLVKSPTFRREIARRAAHRALPDADAKVVKAIDDELDAADYEDESLFGPPPGGASTGGGEPGAGAA